MFIGLPKEIKNSEARIALTPANVFDLTQKNHTVFVQENAGTKSGYSDEDYIKAGGTMLPTIEDVYEKATLIVKVKEPQPSELLLIKSHHTIYTYLRLAADRNLTETLLNSGATCIAYETIQLPNRTLPLLSPMSEIAGKVAMSFGLCFLSNPNGGKGLFISGVAGTRRGKVVIIGAGVAGQSALKIAYGVGADVTILDTDLEKLRYVNDIYHNKVETLYSSKANIQHCLKHADLVIGTVLIPGDKAPKLVTKEDLKLMEKGSVLVDISIDQGGCFETSRPTTHENPTYVVDGIIHYCVANIPGAFALTSTNALTNSTFKYLDKIVNLGLKEAIKIHPELKGGVNIYNNNITYEIVAQTFELPFKDLSTLL